MFANWRKSSRSTANANCVEIAFSDWRKSSYSSDIANCVEIAMSSWCEGGRGGDRVIETAVSSWCESNRGDDRVKPAVIDASSWCKSSRSTDTANCVEVAVGESVFGVRDSKNADGPILVFPQARWEPTKRMISGRTLCQ